MRNELIGRTTLLGISAALVAEISVHSVSFTFPVDRPVPDGLDTGIADTGTVVGLDGVTTHLSVDLYLAGRGGGGWNGDLYATLVHDSGFAVLLNRPGKTSSDPVGFNDDGLNITLKDVAPADVHLYRDPFDPLAGPLTGAWQPDGRGADPASVIDSDPRDLLLSNFTGLDPNGKWTLFVADLEYGGAVQLVSWGLNITALPALPDSALMGLGAAAILGVTWFGSVCRRKFADRVSLGKPKR